MPVFRRKIYDRLLQWKRESGGQTAFLLKGARRVGKSTIVEEFARREYASYIMIDFSIAHADIKELFSRIGNLNAFFIGLQTLTGVKLHQRRSVIVFDEVQLFPPARQAVKHLVNDGRYDYIETGSLLSIKKNVKGILIPSEETRVSMYPMDYEEFLWALGKEGTFEGIRVAFEGRHSFGDAINRSLMRDFRLYMLVGGMPQAVSTFLEANDFSAVDRVKRAILELYADDLRKVDPLGRLSRLFLSIPAELSRKFSTRYQVSSVMGRGSSAGRMSGLLMDLADSMTVNFAYHANDPSVGFAMHTDPSRFKLFLADTGLFVTMAFMDREFTENDLYRRLLSDKLSADLGYLYENVVAQLLKAAGHELFYHTFKDRSDNENSAERTYEVDFLIARGKKIVPVEVKSSTANQHKSLDKFARKYSARVSTSCVLYTKDLRRKGNVDFIPVYMAGLL